jgi:Tfp pilus assembly protein PilO
MSKVRQWVVITAVVVLVILAGGYLLLVKSQKSKVADLHEQTTAQLQTNQVLLTQIEQLQAEQSQLPAQQQALQKFSTQIPDAANEPTLIRQLSSAARGAGVDLQSISPSAPTPVTVAAPSAQSLGAAPPSALALNSLPLSLSVVGSYANVESFFQTLEKLPRSLLITAFSITPGGTAVTGGQPSGGTSPNGKVTVSISAQVFFTPQAAAAPTTGTQTLGSAPPATPPSTAPSTAATPAPGTTPAATPSTASTPASAT